MEFVNCTGNNAIFSNANLYACKFNNSHFDNANFTRANILDYSNYKTWNDIENSSFKSASFERANIEGMNIDSSDFQNANLGVAELRYNTISNSDFRQANLCSKFERTEFKDTKLENTGLDNIESYKDSGVLFVDGEMRNPTHKDYIDKKDFFNGFVEAQKEGISEVEFIQSVIEHRHKSNLEDLKKAEEQYLKDIQGGNYDKAYNFIPSWNYEKETAQKIFMRDVIKEHGTKEIESALDVVADKENMSTEEKAKLFQNTMKTDEYKKALEKEQGKTQEAVNAR